jgi:hypothetical protein
MVWPLVAAKYVNQFTIYARPSIDGRCPRLTCMRYGDGAT